MMDQVSQSRTMYLQDFRGRAHRLYVYVFSIHPAMGQPAILRTPLRQSIGKFTLVGYSCLSFNITQLAPSSHMVRIHGCRRTEPLEVLGTRGYKSLLV